MILRITYDFYYIIFIIYFIIFIIKYKFITALTISIRY